MINGLRFKVQAVNIAKLWAIIENLDESRHASYQSLIGRKLMPGLYKIQVLK